MYKNRRTEDSGMPAHKIIKKSPGLSVHSPKFKKKIKFYLDFNKNAWYPISKIGTENDGRIAAIFMERSR